MGTTYSHLSLEERCRLRGMMEMGLSIGEIAGLGLAAILSCAVAAEAESGVRSPPIRPKRRAGTFGS